LRVGVRPAQGGQAENGVGRQLFQFIQHVSTPLNPVMPVLAVVGGCIE
jgi:hypothetical protein